MDTEDRDHEEEQAEEAEQRSSPSSRVVHEAIAMEGEEELKRPSSALAWSGFAAGLSMGLSLIAEGLLQAHLPDAPWRSLVSKFGYSVGFIAVILGRQQLFTENTLTPILPLMARKSGVTLRNVARLWGVVLLANLCGGLVFAFGLARLPVFDKEIQEVFYSISRKAVEPGFAAVLCRGILAGWIIALLVWLQPFAEAARLWVILILTYVIGIGHLSHVIAGSIEAFLLAVTGQLPWLQVLTGYLIPALIGNVIGGVAIVTAVNHAQVVAGK